MLNRLMRRRLVVCPPLLLSFVCSLMWLPVAGSAQPVEGRGPAIVLVIPPQKTAEVPDSVAANIEQNLKSLLEIDSALKLLFSDVRDPGPDFVVPDSTPKQPEVQIKPIPVNPKVQQNIDALAKVRTMIEKKQWEGALGRLVNLQAAFGKLVADMDDFSPIVDAQEMTAVAFINGGFSEEGAGAIRALLAIRPDYTGAGQSDRVAAAVDRNRDKVGDAGNLTVNVTPDDAVVYVDGRLVGQGRQVVSGLKRGKHYVRVTGETSFPDGGAVNLKAGDNASVSYSLKSRVVTIAPPPPPPVKSGPRPLVWYGRSGLYAQSGFESDIKAAAAEVFADNVLFTFIARSDNKFHIGAFVGNGLNGGIVEVEKASVELDLSNLYVELLGLETRIQKAVLDPTTGTKIAAQPAIYRMVQAKPKPVPVVVAPAPAPAPVPAPAPAPKPVVVQQAPVVVDSGMPSDFPMDMPSDFPMADTASRGYEQPATTVVEETVVDKEPIYKKWWLWTIVGVVVAGAVGGGVAAYYLTSDSAANVGGSVNW